MKSKPVVDFNDQELTDETIHNDESEAIEAETMEGDFVVTVVRSPKAERGMDSNSAEFQPGKYKCCKFTAKFPFGANLDAAVAKWGADAVFDLATATWAVRMATPIRNVMNRGGTEADCQKALESIRPGVRAKSIGVITVTDMENKIEKGELTQTELEAMLALVRKKLGAS